MQTSGRTKEGKERRAVLRQLEESIAGAKDLSELGNAVFRVGCERMDGNLSLVEWERLRELGAAKRVALIKKLILSYEDSLSANRQQKSMEGEKE